MLGGSQMYKYHGYQVAYSQKSWNKLEEYKNKLAAKQQQGKLIPSPEGPGKR